jgi:DNA-binding NtrC family response regulator
MTILMVDDDVDLRAMFAELMRSLNGDCITAASLGDVERQRSTVLACSLAILDLNLGANVPSGIDVYHWLLRAHFSGKIIFLTGYGPDDPLVQEASRLPNAPTLSKPIDVDQLTELTAP